MKSTQLLASDPNLAVDQVRVDLVLGGGFPNRRPFGPYGFRQRWDNNGIKNRVIARFERERNLRNFNVVLSLMAEEVGFEPTRPSRV